MVTMSELNPDEVLLGFVMKGSTQIAHTVARVILADKDNENLFFANSKVHLHVPAGATPKDGPSVGCTMITSLLSLAMNKHVKKDLAMTREATLTRRVLPIGGGFAAALAVQITGASQSRQHGMSEPPHIHPFKSSKGPVVSYSITCEGTNLILTARVCYVFHIPPENGLYSSLQQSIFSSCYLFRNPFSSTTIGDENHIRTLGDYSKPSHEGYKNTIELPAGNNVVPLRSDTIRLVQNGCSFYGLWSEDPNQHLKDFPKLVNLLDLDGKNRERTCLRLFQFSLRDQASNWLERLPAGSITTWEDLTIRFLVQFFPLGRTAKLHNDILMFQQHHGESLSEAWTRFKDLLQKVPHHGIDLWLQVQIFMTMSIPSQDEPLTT
ncbi:zinc finger, CCHC-type containing protein [Tanacetum coccineum]